MMAQLQFSEGCGGFSSTEPAAVGWRRPSLLFSRHTACQLGLSVSARSSLSPRKSPAAIA